MAEYIVSACLAGFKSRYDGTDKLCDKVRELVESGRAISFCPEQAGGLTAPREPSEIVGGDGKKVLEVCGVLRCGESVNKCTNDNNNENSNDYESFNDNNSKNNKKKCSQVRVISKDGRDVTRRFVRGAQEMLKLARMAGATKAILKANSPSCGVGSIYDGTFSGNITKGDGVAAALLIASGLKVTTEVEFDNDIETG